MLMSHTGAVGLYACRWESPIKPGPSLPYLDLAREHGEQQHDNESRQQPCVLDSEGDQGAAIPLVLLAHFIHLRELRKELECFSRGNSPPSSLPVNLHMQIPALYTPIYY